MMHPTNYTGILIGAVAAWIFGAIYYTALGRIWLAAQGKTIEQCKAEQAGNVPGSVVDPAPTPRCRRHLDGVDAGEVLHLSTGHDESPSDRIGLFPNSGTPPTGLAGYGPVDGPRRCGAAQ